MPGFLRDDFAMIAPQAPVLILGAGATKACRGPLTKEFLPEADKAASDIERDGYVALLDRFLEDVFRLPPRASRIESSYPALPLLISLIDTAIDRNQSLHANFDVKTLREVRAALDYVIFAVLDYKLRGTLPTYHYEAIGHLFGYEIEPQIISLNYDIIIDQVLVHLGGNSFPDYSCDVETVTYRHWRKWGKLFKLHGSLNWMHCANCNRLDLAFSRSDTRYSKAIEQLFLEQDGERNDLERRYSFHQDPCWTCGTFMRPIMITPTQRKDYRNPHISRVWMKAEELLRSAGSAVFVGYSMPPDDVEVIYLFKRGLDHLPPSAITVVEYDPEHRAAENHDVGQRYQSIFGSGIQWRTCGFSGWIDEQRNHSSNCLGAN
jgi:hypothetical protein